ncbi:hypothetical protein [Dongshaea marina]|uniref:hypothetical protein n=1 Tax=Dongshaea marina TaxID=2047966 RepID=UPI000D3E756C|nr:hypothetical protein [Dongshaea marina]
MNLVFSHKNSASSAFKVIGSVEDVIAGIIQPRLINQTFKASDYQFGFEVATPCGIDSMGESVLVNGWCYTASTDKHSQEYLSTISGQEFQSSGCFLLPQGETPCSKFIGYDLALPYADYIEKLYREFNQPLLFAATVQFKELCAAYIAKAPVYNENIFENRDIYYSEPKMTFHNVSCFIIGAVTDYNNPSLSEVNNQLKVVLYHNPFDETNSLSSHTHGVTLDRYQERYEDIHPDNVDKTLHIFNEGSIIEAIQGDIFRIGSVTSL